MRNRENRTSSCTNIFSVIHPSIHLFWLLFSFSMQVFHKIYFLQRFWRRSLFMESTIKWISKEKKCMWPYCSFRSCLCTSKSAHRSFRVHVITSIKSPFKFHKLIYEYFLKYPKKTGQFEEFKYYFFFNLKTLYFEREKKALCNILTDKTMPKQREYFFHIYLEILVVFIKAF